MIPTPEGLTLMENGDEAPRPRPGMMVETGTGEDTTAGTVMTGTGTTAVTATTGTGETGEAEASPTTSPPGRETAGGTEASPGARGTGATAGTGIQRGGSRPKRGRGSTWPRGVNLSRTRRVEVVEAQASLEAPSQWTLSRRR